MRNSRYIFDSLYGQISLPDFVWDVFTCPELQRLREIRLCNTNSLTLTGGANVNRFEHSVGTAYLAMQNVESFPWGLSTTTKNDFILAALLHDIRSAPFGHSAQYSFANLGFEHDQFSESGFEYFQTKLQPIYFGLPAMLPRMLGEDRYSKITDLIAGIGARAKLINGTLDLDNIDNVFRLAFHIGLFESKEVPLELAKAIDMRDDSLLIAEKNFHLIETWFMTRKLLYDFLLLNPDEFSIKCMLEEALSDLIDQYRFDVFWKDTDYTLMEKLSRYSDVTSNIVRRIMVGDLYGCVGLFETSAIELAEGFARKEFREKILKSSDGKGKNSLNGQLSNEGLVPNADTAIHAILDVNKTMRKIEVRTFDGDQQSIGENSRRLLIGVFLRNVDWSMSKLSRNPKKLDEITNLVKKHLSKVLKLDDLKAVKLYNQSV